MYNFLCEVVLMALSADDLKILEEYRYTIMEIDAISQQIEHLRIPMEPAPIGAAPMGERIPGTNDKIHAGVQAADGLDSALQVRLKNLKRRVAAFENVIASVREPRARTIIRLYYGLGYSDEMIARKMGLSRATVWRIRDGLFLKDKEQEVSK